MSAISIETKKVTELTSITTPGDSNVIPIHDGTGLKKITFANFKAKAVEDTEAKIAPLLFNNAGAHNAIYRVSPVRPVPLTHSAVFRYFCGYIR